MRIELSDYFKQQGFRSAYLFVNNTGRNCVELVHETLKAPHRRNKRFISYAKYLWISHHKREVPMGFEIDHINNNPKDDRIENLQLLTKSANIQKEYKDTGRAGKLVADLICPICGTKITKRIAQIRKSVRSQPCCCSTKCSGFLQAKHIVFNRDEYLSKVNQQSYKTTDGNYRY